MNASWRKTGAVAAVALLAGLAACELDTSARGDKRMQAHLRAEGSALEFAMRSNPLRAQFDAASGRAWALHVDRIDVYDATGARTASVLLPGWISATTPYACPPDLAIVRDGHVLVTSNVVPTIWRIDSKTLEVTRHDLAIAERAGRDVGFSRLLYSARNDALYAAGALDNSLWRVDRSLVRAQPIALSPSLPQGCVLSMLPGTAANTLCLQIEHGDWIVTLSADFRSGETHPARCSKERTPTRPAAMGDRYTDASGRAQWYAPLPSAFVTAAATVRPAAAPCVGQHTV